MVVTIVFMLIKCGYILCPFVRTIPLPPKCREVFRLVLSDKLKNREIADVLGISEKTVNIHIAKAYERIAEFVNRRYKEGSIK